MGATDKARPLTLQQRIQRLADQHEIQNLMCRYEYLHVANMHDETIALFAQNTPGVRLENGARGVYDGIEGVRRFYGVMKKGRPVGGLHLHASAMPVIEVAGDGQTAQAVFFSPGVETGPGPTGAITASWAWLRYGVEFVKEDGTWKFWRLHMYRIFFVGHDESWTDSPVRPAAQAVIADRANTYDWSYSRDAMTENVPALPTPYYSWDESRTYVPGPK